jgi:hypothetical protein
VCPKTGNGLDIRGVQSQNFFIINDGIIWIIESVIDPCNAQEEARLHREFVSGHRIRREEREQILRGFE